MARSKSSKRWLQEHFDDPYVQRAQAQGLRSRAAFKLAELQQKHRLIRAGMRVVDLGAAPGGWSQLANRWAGAGGQVFALDIAPMDPLPGVTFIQGDFTERAPLETLRLALHPGGVDLVMSDMAPNISGISAVDQPRAMYLVELALDFACQHLIDGGTLLTKVLQGEGSEAYLHEVRKDFGRVAIIKPKASRPRSREVYVLARGLRRK